MRSSRDRKHKDFDSGFVPSTKIDEVAFLGKLDKSKI